MPPSKVKQVAPKQDAECGASNMFVAVRIRPLSQKELEGGHTPCCHVVDGKVVAIRKEATGGAYLRSQLGRYENDC